MAQDSANHITYFLAIEQRYVDFLGKIRHWNNLKIATEDTYFWVKDFSFEQINSLEVKTIPYKQVYYSQDHKLFKVDSLLPDRNVPTLLWTPIERGLSVELPNYNFNFFGLKDKIDIKLVLSEREKPVLGMIADREVLEEYIQNAPAVRLQKLTWAILNEKSVFIMGEPNLPIRGEIFWQNSNFFLPIGYDFELSILTKTINQLIDPNEANFIVFSKNNNYFLIEKTNLQTLSLSSFRLSFDTL
jgi:MoxR-vWA-beta-propeller ternary system domain bpX2